MSLWSRRASEKGWRCWYVIQSGLDYVENELLFEAEMKCGSMNTSDFTWCNISSVSLHDFNTIFVRVPGCEGQKTTLFRVTRSSLCKMVLNQ
jgi:hypothetical protein